MKTGLRSTSALAVGSAANGVLAYVFFALTTRGLGAEAAAPVSVLWAWWAFAAAAFTFPVQHWIARSVATHGGEGGVRAALPRVAVLVGLVSLVVGGASWLLRESLFGGDGTAFPLLAAAVTAASALTGFVRGVLTGRRRFGAVAVALTAENGLRAILAAALMLAGVGDPLAYGLALLVGFAGALVWPSTLRLHDDGTGPADGTLAFLSGAAGGQLVGQAVLTGGPVVLSLASGAPHEVTALFAGLALFRAPYTLAIGMVAQLTGWVTGLLVARDWAALARARWLLRLAVVAGTVLAVPVGWWVGPPLLRLVFGADVRLDSGDCTLIAVGSALALVNLVATVMLLAQGRTPVLVVTWLAALLPGVATFVLRGGEDPLTTVCVAFLVVEAAATVGLLWEEWRGVRRLRGRVEQPA